MANKLAERKDDKKVVTVILGDTDPDTRKDFHCSYCGRIVFNYYSEVRIIVIGEMREVSRPTDILCSRCKVIYRVA